MFDLSDLSVFLYLADVVPRAAHSLGFVVVCIAAVLAILSFALTMSASESMKEERPPKYKKAIRLVVSAFIVIFMLVPLQLVPSRDTFYLIAGVEAGEVVVNSERGQQLIGKVNAVLDAQLERLSN